MISLCNNGGWRFLTAKIISVELPEFCFFFSLSFFFSRSSNDCPQRGADCINVCRQSLPPSWRPKKYDWIREKTKKKGNRYSRTWPKCAHFTFECLQLLWGETIIAGFSAWWKIWKAKRMIDLISSQIRQNIVKVNPGEWTHDWYLSWVSFRNAQKMVKFKRAEIVCWTGFFVPHKSSKENRWSKPWEATPPALPLDKSWAACCLVHSRFVRGHQYKVSQIPPPHSPTVGALAPGRDATRQRAWTAQSLIQTAPYIRGGSGHAQCLGILLWKP